MSGLENSSIVLKWVLLASCMHMNIQVMRHMVLLPASCWSTVGGGNTQRNKAMPQERRWRRKRLAGNHRYKNAGFRVFLKLDLQIFYEEGNAFWSGLKGTQCILVRNTGCECNFINKGSECFLHQWFQHACHEVHLSQVKNSVWKTMCHIGGTWLLTPVLQWRENWGGRGSTARQICHFFKDCKRKKIFLIYTHNT